MPFRQIGRHSWKRLRTVLTLLATTLLVGASLAPLLTQSALADPVQLEPREETVNTSQPSAPVRMNFVFNIPASATASAIQAIKFEFCDNALGACGSGGGGSVVNTPSVPASAPTISQSGWTNATAFAGYARQNGDDGGTNNQIKITRTEPLTESHVASCDNTFPVQDADIQASPTNCLDIGFVGTGLNNNSGSNKAYYVRVTLYSDTAATAEVFYGTVAQSTGTTLTVNARVQEHLDFCVGETPDDDDVTNPATAGGTNGNCTDISGSTVDIGTISTSLSISPVGASPNGGNGMNGIAMVASNGANGTVISYYAQPTNPSDTCTSTPSGHCDGLKITNQNCGITDFNNIAPSFTDKCFNDSTTHVNLATATTEGFGMTIGKVNFADVGNAYVGGANMVPLTDYNGNCTGNSCTDFAWDDTGTPETLASSASSTIKVVNYEALILKFAARAAATTPTGQYTVSSTYIATSAY